MKKNVAHIITLTNLCVGFLSIIESCSFNFNLASYFIFTCCFLDVLDGFIARILNSESEFGKQLDSFSDFISFGVAPAILMYSFIAFEFNNYKLAHISLLIPICSSLRLVKYNLYNTSQETFSGLTTPVSAIVFSSIPLIHTYEKNIFIINTIIQPITIVLLIIVISALLLAPFQTFNLRIRTLLNDKRKMIFIFFSIYILYIFNFTGLLVIVLTYIILSMIKVIH